MAAKRLLTFALVLGPIAILGIAPSASAYDLDRNLTLNAQRPMSPVAGNTLNLNIQNEKPVELESESVNQKHSSGSLPMSHSSTGPSQMSLDSAYKMPALVTPIGGRKVQGLTVPITQGMSLSVAESKAQGAVYQNNVSGLHLISKMDKNRSLYMGVEKVRSDVDETRAGVGVLFDLD